MSDMCLSMCIHCCYCLMTKRQCALKKSNGLILTATPLLSLKFGSIIPLLFVISKVEMLFIKLLIIMQISNPLNSFFLIMNLC